MAKNCFVPLLSIVTRKPPSRVPEISRITELINCNITKLGNGAMGNGQWAMGNGNKAKFLSMPYAPCPMPHYPLPIP
jgi:hypothetical protein